MPATLVLLYRWRRPLMIAITILFMLLIIAQTARADTIEVTFTGSIYWVFPGLDVEGIAVDDPFYAALTYNPSQDDLNPLQELGYYYDHLFTVTVQTSSGDAVFGGSYSGYPVIVGRDYIDDYSRVLDIVHNAGAGVAFILEDFTRTSLTSDSLADVDWQQIHALSERPRIFLRAPSAAVIVEGGIDSVGVRRIPAPIPEPSTLTLLGIGLLGLIGYGWRRRHDH